MIAPSPHSRVTFFTLQLIIIYEKVYESWLGLVMLNLCLLLPLPTPSHPPPSTSTSCSFIHNSWEMIYFIGSLETKQLWRQATLASSIFAYHTPHTAHFIRRINAIIMCQQCHHYHHHNHHYSHQGHNYWG